MESISNNVVCEEMIITFRRWASIEGLSNVRRNLQTNKNKETGEFIAPYDVIPNSGLLRFAGKIKLHGVNSAISVDANGHWKIQSRNTFLDEGSKGGFGFVKWAENNAGWISTLYEHVSSSSLKQHEAFADLHAEKWLTVFGEWCGPGVQKGVALAKLKECVFCVFSVQIGQHLIVEPELLKMVVKNAPPTVHVLPWHRDAALVDQTFIDVPLLSEDNDARLEACAAQMNQLVERIDKEDPWVLEHFGVRGAGEGIVWYPVALVNASNRSLMHVDHFGAFSFKTKGSSHQMVAAPEKSAAAAVQTSVQKAANPKSLADMFLTEPRFQQGIVDGCQGVLDADSIKTFVEWVVGDVKKESKAELAESKIAWERVEPIVRGRAEQWAKKFIEENAAANSSKNDDIGLGFGFE